MIDRRSVFGLMGAGAVGLSGAGAARASPPPRDVVAALDELRAGTSTVGGAIVAVRDGRPISTYMWGKASLPFDVPVTDRTLFHIGSNAKLMTAVAVLQLATAAGISLDDPIGAHLPGLPAIMAAAPISSLLHHTSGLPDYSEVFPDWDRPQTREIVSAAFQDKALAFPTGAAWSYSNTNYLILGWLIEHLSGQSYGDYVRTRLFEPAGMPTARVDAAQQVVQNRAEPYEIGEDGAIRHAVRMEDGVSRAADGGLLLSVQDAGPWRAALDRNRLISAEDMARVLTPAPLSSGRLAAYGFAVFLDQTRGAPLLRHSGGVPGFGSYWMTWPEADLSILAMMNSMGGKGAPMERMALTLAESIEPGVTWLEQEPMGDGSDARTQALRGLLQRPEGAPPASGLLASEQAHRDGVQLPRAPTLQDIRPLERWFIGDGPKQGEMVRYRVWLPTRTAELLVGWTDEDQIYWI